MERVVGGGKFSAFLIFLSSLSFPRPSSSSSGVLYIV